MKKIGIRKILMFGTAGCCLIGAAGAKAQTCTPAPDCESLGYDQSVCPGGFLRCPFDADKLFCTPECNLTITAEQCAAECKNPGKLSCIREGVTYYSECGDSLCRGTEQCEQGQKDADDNWSAGVCTAGGLGGILYSDMTVSREIVSGKTAIGVIATGDADSRHRLVVALKDSGDLKWSTAVSDLSLTNYALKEDALKDRSGKESTSVLVAASGDNSQHAGGYCYNYTTAGTKKGQWYLPGAGELHEAFYTNGSRLAETLSRISGAAAPVTDGLYWTATERDETTAWGVKFGEDVVHYGSKTAPDTVKKARCFFEVTYNDDGTVAPVCETGYHWENSACTPDCGNGEYWDGSACKCQTQYTQDCTADGNVSGGEGIECGGKYASCSCVAGASWNGSDCVCNSSYKYSCDGAGELPDTSNGCGGKYKACGCEAGYYWSNGVCKVNCSTLCDTGNIYYSDGTCSSCYNSAKTAIGVIALNQGSARLVISLNESELLWAPMNEDVSGMGEASSGKSETSTWVGYYGAELSDYAPGYCYNYTTTGTSKGQWFLPSLEEYEKIMSRVTAVNRGLVETGSQALSGDYYTSTQLDKDNAAVSSGGKSDKQEKQKTRCLMYMEVNDTNDKGTLCNAAYKYSCSGAGYLCGLGETCGWLFKNCQCTEGYYNQDNRCYSCDASCDEIGSIYYSDGTCSLCWLTSKTPVGVVAYKSGDKRFMISLENKSMKWSADQVDIAALRNFSSAEAAKLDMEGKENTRIIVEHYGADTDVSTNAAVYCYNYAPEALSETKGQWYLPAAGEAYLSYYANNTMINKGLKTLGLTNLGDRHWSSSEYGNYCAWGVRAVSGGVYSGNKGTLDGYVRCVLAF